MFYGKHVYVCIYKLNHLMVYLYTMLWSMYIPCYGLWKTCINVYRNLEMTNKTHNWLVVDLPI